jgi:hypothetical protein
VPPPADAPADPVAALGRLAARLEAAHAADPGNAALGRVLKDTLLVLAGPAEPGAAGDDDPLAELRAIIADVP